MWRRLFILISACALLGLSNGCAVIDYFFVAAPEETALDLFQLGQDEMAQENWDDAVDYFTKLRDRYPFSPYTVQAELLLADAYFNDRSYAEAIVAYKEYESLHPNDQRIPYVLFQIGLANFKSMRSVDKPQSHARDSVEYFQRLIQSHPKSEYTAQAQDYLLQARRQLAEHELFVADFYWRAGRYGSAWERYSYVVGNFKDVPEAAEYAEKRARLAYLERQQSAAEAARVKEHGSWKQWFNWL